MFTFFFPQFSTALVKICYILNENPASDTAPPRWPGLGLYNSVCLPSTLLPEHTRPVPCPAGLSSPSRLL